MNPVVHVTIANATLESVVRCASDMFGGCTAHETLGGWTDEKGAIVIEPGVHVTIMHDYDAVLEWARRYGRTIGETAVFVEFNGGAEIIYTQEVAK